ncbi:MAG: hypothetical protein JNM17_40720 [Archangium sp.]|nr:hypothetical protein [Archangium sp.]
MRSLLATLILAATTSSPQFTMPSKLETLLANGKWDATPKSFRIIALSHLADGCVGQSRARPGTQVEARKCVEDVLKQALALGKVKDGLFLSHLNLIYGAADQLGACIDERAHEALTQELVKRSMADPTFHASSYEGVALRWPADQTVTLASIARFDAAHGTTLLTAPLAGWEKVMSKHLDPKTKLPESEVTGRGPGAKHPRGCAQSYITRYLSEADPKLAATWWTAYRANFLVRMGPIVGFREWPVGVERKGDVDSGPIIMGIGTAASAFALAAAKAQGDVLLAGQLEANETALLSTGIGGEMAHLALAEAIAFQGTWQPVGAGK